MQFAVFAAGNIVGPHLFFAREAPRYPSAIKGLLGCYCVAIALQVAYLALCQWENKRRDAKGYHAQVETEAMEGFEDRTDLENKNFRVCSNAYHKTQIANEIQYRL
jgi:hypothetical protein